MWRRLVAWWPFMLVRTHQEARAQWERARTELRMEYRKEFARKSSRLDAVYDRLSSLRLIQESDRGVTLSMAIDERMLSSGQDEREFIAEDFARYIRHHFARLIVIGRR